MGRIIAIANQKGGVGKTTTAINLGAALASQHMWTLVVDCDPQANTTGGLGFPKDPARKSLYHGLMAETPLASLVLTCAPEGLHLIPSDRNLVGATVELVEARVVEGQPTAALLRFEGDAQPESGHQRIVELGDFAQVAHAEIDVIVRTDLRHG